MNGDIARLLASPPADLAIALYACVFFIGLCLGSFATALAWRLPRDISVMRDADGSPARSRCGRCKTVLTPLDLIPLISWVRTRGKCRHCGQTVSWVYPAIELACALFCVAAALRFGFSPTLLMMMAAAPLLVALIDIDFKFQIIPDVINIALAAIAVIGILVIVTAGDLSFVSIAGRMATGCIVYGGGFLFFRWLGGKIFKREAMGLGDVKFMAAAGLWMNVSVEQFQYFLLIAGSSGVLLGLYLKFVCRQAEPELPFGPSLVIAFCVSLFWHGTIFS